MKILLFPFLIFVFSCNSLSGHIEQQVETKVEDAKEEMNAEIERAKENFKTHYQAAEKNELDSLQKRKLQELDSSINSTDNYLDSMKREMDQLDVMHPRNIELVSAIFLYRGVGDSIFNKLKRSIVIAQSSAKTEQQKLAIKAASDSLFTQPSADKWKEHKFGSLNSLGASVIIYGLQKDLHNIGMQAISDK